MTMLTTAFARCSYLLSTRSSLVALSSTATSFRMPEKPIVYHIPICPFSQRIEILLTLKGHKDAVEFPVIDVTKPRSPELLKKTRGSTTLPVLETASGDIIKESLVILNYLDEIVPGGRVRRKDPLQHAIENMLIAKEGPFTIAGYTFVMNQDLSARDAFRDKLLALYRDMNDFLLQYSPQGPFLFESFGLAEVVFTPLFQRFWFLDYYEDFELPDTEEYKRVAKWRKACLEHPATKQVCHDEVVKIYYDYAKGAGNGVLLQGRKVSSFAFEPKFEERPMPPANKYEHSATDEELGLL